MGNDDGTLRGWKAIARHLGREVRTVQLWERDRGLPVHRIPGGPGQSVFARAAELDAWTAGSATAVADAGRAPGLLVLPFAYRGGDVAERGFVGEATSAEVLNRLAVAPLSDLRVLSATTARVYAQSALRADQLAAELGIRYLVEGGVIEAGDRWSVDVRVVDAAADRIVLADRFEGIGRDALRVNRTIAEAVAGHLSLRIADRMVEPFWNRAVDPASFLAFIRALQSLARPGVGGLAAALRHADEALAIDPDFAPAYVTRAMASLNQYQYQRNGDPDAFRHARRLAEDAFARAPELASAQTLAARWAGVYDFRWDRAEELHRGLVRTLPSDANNRAQLAYLLGLRGRDAEAQQQLDVVRDLDRSPTVTQTQAGLSIWRRDYPRAIEEFDATLAAAPGHYYAWVTKLGVLALMQGNELAARAHVATMPDELRAKFGSFADACVKAAAPGRPQFAAARAVVAADADAGRALHYHAAMLHAVAGDADGAMDQIDAALANPHGEILPHLGVEPVFDALRASPRFRAQLAKVNLAA